jgi:protein-disulfide isomerase
MVILRAGMGSPAGEQEGTRKERREQARAQRRAQEQAAMAQAVRRKRLTQLGAVAAVVVIVIVIVLAATGGGGHKAVVLNGKTERSASAAVTSLLRGVPQSGNTLGSPTAPVTLQYFGDLECPYCREFTLSSLPTLISKYVRAGKLKIQYRSMETATHESATFTEQQVAALAAGKQARMWNYVELFYHEQGDENSGYVTEAYLQKLAAQVPGLSLSQWTSDRNDPVLNAQVTSDEQAANQGGITGTPSFLLGKTGAHPSTFTPSSFTEPAGFESAIEKLLA